MTVEAIFAGDGIFENEIFERLQSERHIGAKKNKSAKAGKILENWRNGGHYKNGIKSELAQNYSGIKSDNIDDKNLFFGKALVRIED